MASNPPHCYIFILSDMNEDLNKLGGHKTSLRRRLWPVLVFMVVYSAISLYFLQKYPPAIRTVDVGDLSADDGTREPPREKVVLPPNPATLRETSPRDTLAAASFEIKYRRDTPTNAASLVISLALSGKAQKCTVQVQAVCDHHYTYSHTYPYLTLSKTARCFNIPLSNNDRWYWTPEGHKGQWSGWERITLRKLNIKVFSPNIPENSVSCEYGYIPQPPAPPTLAWAEPAPQAISLGERWETMFDMNSLPGNPYDEKYMPVTCAITDPTGAVRTIAGFLYEDYDLVLRPQGEQISPRGQKHWRVRYRPLTTGEHSYAISCQPSGAGTPARLLAGRFSVTAGRQPDFIQISPRSKRYFAHADGSFYYPVGWNMISPVDKIDTFVSDCPYLPEAKSLTFHRKLLEDLAASGANITGLWLTTEWLDIEGPPAYETYSGPGRYNLRNAWMLDKLLETCERRNVRVILDAYNTNRLLDPLWEHNAYNRAAGGFLDHPVYFWTDRRANNFMNSRIRYIVARYADTPAIQSWNFISEPDRCLMFHHYSDTICGSIGRYLREFRRLDIYGRPTSNQVNNPTGFPQVWQIPEVEFPTYNAYAYPESARGYSEDQLLAIRDASKAFDNIAKPLLVREYGGNHDQDPFDKVTQDMLTGLWAGLCSRFGAAPMVWWNNLMHGDQLGWMYTLAADFMKGEDLAAYDRPETGGWMNRPAKCAAPDSSRNPGVLMVGNNTRRFVFLYDYLSLCRVTMPLKPVKNVTVAFDDMTPGKYEAELWNIRTGRTGQTIPLEIRDSNAELVIPEIRDGIVAKIRPAAPGAQEHAPEAPKHPPSATALARALSADAGKWSWKIIPLLEQKHRLAAQRCAVEVTLALPDSCAFNAPVVKDASGQQLNCPWEFLPGGLACRIRITSTNAPFTVTLGPPPSADPPLFDDIGLGLLAESVAGPGSKIDSTAWFNEVFQNAGSISTSRIARLDHLMNPAGNNNLFVTRYRGPIFIPTNGLYTLGVNLDDGGVLSIDGQVLLSRLGRHNADSVGRPDLWTNLKKLELKEGIHWLACYQQEIAGRQTAQAAWIMPELAPGSWQRDYFADPVDAIMPPIEIIRENVLSGLIPAAVEIRQNGSAVATLAPCRGLLSRRPHKEIHAVGLRAGEWNPGSKRRILWSTSPERRIADVQGAAIPVWIASPSFRKFSFEWDQCRSAGHELIRLRTFDIAMPLHLTLPSARRDTAVYKRRDWRTTNLGHSDIGGTFTISFEGIPLDSGLVKPWPYVEPSATPLPDVKTCSRLVLPAPAPFDVRIPPAEMQKLSGIQAAEISFVTFDTWAETETPLSSLSGSSFAENTGVLLVLNDSLVHRGVGADEFAALLDTRIREICAAKALPILVIDKAVTLENPLMYSFAAAITQTARKYGCPLVDLRSRSE